MVIVEPKKGITYYMDDHLKRSLDKIKEKLLTKDFDSVLCIDGGEGQGKSTLAMQIGFYMDNTLNIKRICMSGKEFMYAVTHAKRGQCVVFDEAFTGLSSRNALSQINNLIISLVMEARQRNLFLVVVLPTFFMLDRYVALFRSRNLIHVYLKNGKRGRYAVFNKRRKQYLYLHGKKEYDYNVIRPIFRGRFIEKYPLDEKEYRTKHMLAFTDKSRVTKDDKYMEQRNLLIKYIVGKEDLTLINMSDLCKKIGISLKSTQLSDILRGLKDKSDKTTENNSDDA